MEGQNIRQKVQIVISGAFNNKSVHFFGVIIVLRSILHIFIPWSGRIPPKYEVFL
jgi:hypothetical protein